MWWNKIIGEMWSFLDRHLVAILASLMSVLILYAVPQTGALSGNFRTVNASKKTNGY